jgi:hypothetical protein
MRESPSRPQVSGTEDGFEGFNMALGVLGAGGIFAAQALTGVPALDEFDSHHGDATLLM